MPKSLSGELISDWYTSLLHVSSAEINPTVQNTLYDGMGNESSLSIALEGGGITVTGAITADDFLGGDQGLTEGQIRDALDAIYPVNKVYLSSDSVDPATRFTGTTWDLLDCDLCAQYTAGSSPCAQNGLDIIFTIDDTGSMRNSIDTVKKNMSTIISLLDNNKTITPVQVGIYTFKDAKEPTLRYSLGDPYSGSFTTAVNNIVAGGGGDADEAGASAIYKAVTDLKGSSAEKIIIHMTDNITKPDSDYPSMYDASQYAKINGVKVYAINYATGRYSRQGTIPELTALANNTDGLYFEGHNENTSSSYFRSGDEMIIDIMKDVNSQACPEVVTTSGSKVIFSWKRTS